MEKKRKKKAPADRNQLATSIVDQATCTPACETTTGDALPTAQAVRAHKEKTYAAVALGSLGGLKDGKAREESLSAKRRKEKAEKLAQKRWLKK